MSITKETAMQHKEDPAVTCCRFEAGQVVEPSTLEDPAIFADLEDSGLLEITDATLTIGQVLGAKLKETVDSLTPLTADMLEELPEPEAEETDEAGGGEAAPTVEVKRGEPSGRVAVVGYATLKIAKGENIEITFPVYG